MRCRNPPCSPPLSLRPGLLQAEPFGLNDDTTPESESTPGLDLVDDFLSWLASIPELTAGVHGGGIDADLDDITHPSLQINIMPGQACTIHSRGQSLKPDGRTAPWQY